MGLFVEFTPRAYDTGAAATDAELYKSTQPQAPIELGNAMRLWYRARSLVEQTGTITPELNHQPLVADGVPVGADDLVEIFIFRTGDTQGHVEGVVTASDGTVTHVVEGVVTASDGTVTRVVGADVLGLNWNRAQQFRMIGRSDQPSGIRLEALGIQR